MVEFHQFDYGQEVKVLEGKHKDRVGYVVGGHMGEKHVYIIFDKDPKKHTYDAKETPSNLEILSSKDFLGKRKDIKKRFNNTNPFTTARVRRMMLTIDRIFRYKPKSIFHQFR